ncbi:hypothetical protein I2I11_12750 [Pontibacter sp. 172403-2]|uniref:hypothetical protein n=1 Tax=Pontibacter rufus TaxID=2791028 RepID=UPI0018AFC608|nr:hypothetical protein [Pontibacter sp. 172403-2]MBF9254166.1 hypothetical protein [Pontibacter sp. 172403-2]
MEYEVIQAGNLQLLASTVKAYLQKGWVLKGEFWEQNGTYAQEIERSLTITDQSAKNLRLAAQQKSWISWSTFRAA